MVCSQSELTILHPAHTTTCNHATHLSQSSHRGPSSFTAWCNTYVPIAESAVTGAMHPLQHSAHTGIVVAAAQTARQLWKDKLGGGPEGGDTAESPRASLGRGRGRGGSLGGQPGRRARPRSAARAQVQLSFLDTSLCRCLPCAAARAVRLHGLHTRWLLRVGFGGVPSARLTALLELAHRSQRTQGLAEVYDQRQSRMDFGILSTNT